MGEVIASTRKPVRTSSIIGMSSFLQAEFLGIAAVRMSMASFLEAGCSALKPSATSCTASASKPAPSSQTGVCCMRSCEQPERRSHL